MGEGYGKAGAGIGVGGVPLMSELVGIVRFKFHEGKIEEFKRLSARAMEIVRAQDTGTLQYDTYFNEDQSEAIVIERFRDSQALIEHGDNVAALMEPIIATAAVSGELLGELSPELRAKMTGDNPQLFRLYKSM
jgi:quinol monooxygenase YgiN